MAGSDDEYVQSSDDDAPRRGGRKERGKQRAAWEASIHEREKPLLGSGGDAGSLGRDLRFGREERLRARLRQDTQPFQRGIIRHICLILDLSEAMLEKDYRPGNRFTVTLRNAQEYVHEFFEQNPISQMCVLGMHDGICIRVSEMSGNPNDHVTAIQGLRLGRSAREPAGAPSLQNSLEMARAALYHTPRHGTREVIIVMGALLTVDPGDIHDTVRSCVKDRLRVQIIGMSGRLKICQDICEKTNSGDMKTYTVALDQIHFRELLLATTTPPVIRKEEEMEINKASLLQMGFPSRIEEETPTLCACHSTLSRGGYLCSRCKAKVCSLPQNCPVCDLTLILSTHLARSYHHLFPLRNWVAVPWTRVREIKSTQCRGCLAKFPNPPAGNDDEDGDEDEESSGVRRSNGVDKSDNSANALRKKSQAEKGASESSRYECQACQEHFCIECDLFCHEVVHNCPGCLGKSTTNPRPRKSGPDALNGKNMEGVVLANGHS